MQSDEREIRELVERWMSASKAGDVETVLSLMTDDVVFLVAGQPPMIGKSTFAAAAEAQSEAPFEIDGRSEIQEIRVLREWAYMWARLSVVMTPAQGGQPIRRAGHTLSVLKKEGGRWHLARDANLLTVVQEGELRDASTPIGNGA